MYDFDYWYMATVYTQFPGTKEEAYKFACEQAVLARQQLDRNIFSPIAHSHGLVKFGLPATGQDFWMAFDRPFMANAEGLLVIQSEGWEKSLGINHEIGFFYGLGKPIEYHKPLRLTRTKNGKRKRRW